MTSADDLFRPSTAPIPVDLGDGRTVHIRAISTGDILRMKGFVAAAPEVERDFAAAAWMILFALSTELGDPLIPAPTAADVQRVAGLPPSVFEKLSEAATAANTLSQVDAKKGSRRTPDSSGASASASSSAARSKKSSG
ncbi:MAG: hypothetical protein ABI780_02665 [Ardenticatenales bacterium]